MEASVGALVKKSFSNVAERQLSSILKAITIIKKLCIFWYAYIFSFLLTICLCLVLGRFRFCLLCCFLGAST